MANVNKFIWNIVIPVLFLIYVLFLVWEHNSRSDGNRSKIIRQHQIQSKSYENIDGVILGGSNAFFGLSATELSQLTSLNWVNLSLPNEGFSDINYLNFLYETLDYEQRLSVKDIIYSSITPLRLGRISEIENNIYDLYGNKGISYIPERSLAAVIKRYFFDDLQENMNFPLPLSKGDFNFSDFECSIFQNIQYIFERETNILLLNSWVTTQMLSISDIFPNATIFFVVPSEFYDNLYDKKKDDALSDRLSNIIEELSNKSNINNNNFYYVKQKQFPSIDYLCDAIHHSNDYGRTWRTSDLAKFISY